MKRALGSMGLLVALVASSLTAQAQRDPYEFDRAGVYVGMAATYMQYTQTETRLQEAADDLGIPATITSQGGAGLTGRLGYRLRGHFAAELTVDYLPESIHRANGQTAFIIQGGALTANGKVFILTGRFQPFVSAGLGILRAEVDTVLPGFERTDTDHGIAARFSGGIDIYATRHVAVTSEVAYLLTTGNIQNFDQVVVGLGITLRY